MNFLEALRAATRHTVQYIANVTDIDENALDTMLSEQLSEPFTVYLSITCCWNYGYDVNIKYTNTAGEEIVLSHHTTWENSNGGYMDVGPDENGHYEQIENETPIPTIIELKNVNSGIYLDYALGGGVEVSLNGETLFYEPDCTDSYTVPLEKLSNGDTVHVVAHWY